MSYYHEAEKRLSMIIKAPNVDLEKKDRGGGM